MQRYRRLIRAINLTLNQNFRFQCYEAATLLCAHRQPLCTLLPGKPQCAILRRSVCTVKRNKPHIHNDHMLREQK